MSIAEPKAGTREAILDATDRIMARYGFRKMTIEDLAKEASVSKRTVYHYFTSKEDVGLSSIGRVVEQTHQRMESLANSDGDVPEILRALLVERVMARVRQVQDYYLSLDELFEAVRPAYMQRRQAYFDREVEIIASLLHRGASSGILHLESPMAVAEALVLATNAFLPYSLSVADLGNPDGIETRLRFMADLLIDALVCPAKLTQRSKI